MTGASGFLGSNLIEALNARGGTPRALLRATSSRAALVGLRCEPVIGDVLEMDTLRSAMRGVKVVLHAAAVVDDDRHDEATLYRVNVDGTRNVLASALEAGVERVVVVSSVAALGRPAWDHPADERQVFNLRPAAFPYGYSKALAEQVTRAFVARGLHAVIINPTVILGPRDVNHVSARMLTELARRPLPFYPPGGVSVVDVGDVCAGVLAALARGEPGRRHVLAGDNLTHRALLGAIADTVGVARPWLPLPRAVAALAHPLDGLRRRGLRLPMNGGQLRMSTERWWYDSTRARAALGFTTRPALETLARTWAWLRAQP